MRHVRIRSMEVHDRNHSMEDRSRSILHELSRMLERGGWARGEVQSRLE